jgi:hypothetical protein
MMLKGIESDGRHNQGRVKQNLLRRKIGKLWHVIVSKIKSEAVCINIKAKF